MDIPDPSLLVSNTFTTANQLLSCVDKKVVVALRDGRKLFGVLRSFDQFANFVLQDTIERIYLGSKYAEKSIGVYIIRGENVVYLGVVDLEQEEEVHEKVDFDELLPEYTAHTQEKLKIMNENIQKLHKRGLHDDVVVDAIY